MMSSTTVKLFEGAKKLDDKSLDNLINEMMALRAQRKVSYTHKQEIKLLEKINKTLNHIEQQRFTILNNKRLEGNISVEEQIELMTLIDKLERLNVYRLKNISQLARLRNVSVRELMKDLGFNSLVANA